jgi:hypothetical protein
MKLCKCLISLHKIECAKIDQMGSGDDESRKVERYAKGLNFLSECHGLTLPLLVCLNVTRETMGLCI